MNACDRARSHGNQNYYLGCLKMKPLAWFTSCSSVLIVVVMKSPVCRFVSKRLLAARWYDDCGQPVGLWGMMADEDCPIIMIAVKCTSYCVRAMDSLIKVFQSCIMYSWKRKRLDLVLRRIRALLCLLPTLWSMMHPRSVVGDDTKIPPSRSKRMMGTSGVAAAMPTIASNTNRQRVALTPPIGPTMPPTTGKNQTFIQPHVPSLIKSFLPTRKPSQLTFPTVHPIQKPFLFPSDSPSLAPSQSPSVYPTSLPTSEEIMQSSGTFKQQFNVTELSSFNDSEVLRIERLFESYTQFFGDPLLIERINSTCEIIRQMLAQNRTALRVLKVVNESSMTLNSSALNTLVYRMTYSSFVVNVVDYPAAFYGYMTNNVPSVVADLQTLDLDVTDGQPPEQLVVTNQPTFSPSVSALPSPAPSLDPTSTSTPSFNPTKIPTHRPTINTRPTTAPTKLTDQPSVSPSLVPHASSPKNNDDTVTVVAVSAAGALALILIGLLIFFWWRRKKLRESAFQAIQNNEVSNSGSRRKRTPSRIEIPRVSSWGIVSGQHQQHSGRDSGLMYPVAATTDSRSTAMPYTSYSSIMRGKESSAGAGPGLISPCDSMVSHQSLLSTGNLIETESVDNEPDATQNLADEFDQYKDQNLESMRVDVEGNLSGFDGMMSQALTKALMEDDELNSDPKELLWGGHGKQSGIEIEASALCEVNDWLKRVENATTDESRAFMQDILNKMVASVRHGVIGPKEASRAVHECAAFLGLPLATEMPGSTLIVTGLRKTSTAEDVIQEFRIFGDIEEAAVASNQRGFAVVRYTNSKSVDRAFLEYRTGEIVVQDVAVQVKILRVDTVSSSSSAPPSQLLPPPLPPPVDNTPALGLDGRDALPS